MKSVMQRLYDSEINAAVSTFWDGGFDVKLGDAMNGFDAQTSVRTFVEVEAWLEEEAKRLYPNSLFATGEYPEGYAIGPCGAGLPGSTALDGVSIAV